MTVRTMPKSVRLLLSLFFVAQAVPAPGRDPLHTPINGPCRLAFDATGNLYVNEEYGKQILRIDWKRNTTTVAAGNGKECCFAESAPARRSSIYSVYSIALDVDGNLFIGGRNHDDGAFVRVVDSATQHIRSVAKGHSPVSVEGVRLLDANLSDPLGMVTGKHNLQFVSASIFEVIVELGEKAATFAGNGRKGFFGDGGPARDASFDWPGALAMDSNGNLFVADYHNHRVRRIDAKTRKVTTVAGNGSQTPSGDGGPAISAGVPYPFDIAVDGVGNIFIIENGQWAVRRVDGQTGLISTVAGTGEEGYSGDGGPATQAKVDPCGLALDRAENLYISDVDHNLIRRVDARTRIISTVAGNGLPKRKINIM